MLNGDHRNKIIGYLIDDRCPIIDDSPCPEFKKILTDQKYTGADPGFPVAVVMGGEWPATAMFQKIKRKDTWTPCGSSTTITGHELPLFPI